MYISDSLTTNSDGHLALGGADVVSLALYYKDIIGHIHPSLE